MRIICLNISVRRGSVTHRDGIAIDLIQSETYSVLGCSLDSKIDQRMLVWSDQLRVPQLRLDETYLHAFGMDGAQDPILHLPE